MHRWTIPLALGPPWKIPCGGDGYWDNPSVHASPMYGKGGRVVGRTAAKPNCATNGCYCNTLNWIRTASNYARFHLDVLYACTYETGGFIHMYILNCIYYTHMHVKVACNANYATATAVATSNAAVTAVSLVCAKKRKLCASTVRRNHIGTGPQIPDGAIHGKRGM